MRLIQENGRSPLTTTILAAGLALAAILVSSSGSNAWVTISSPSNDSLVSGSVAVKASVSNDWWAQLVVDGNAVASGSPGNVSFTWNTTTVGDGAHWVTIKGYPKGGQSADSAETVAVSVLNHVASDHSIRFGTLAESAPLPSASWCAQVVPFETEMIPDNATPNHTMPTAAQLTSYAANGYTAYPDNGSWAYARANGQYTGTTDMIIRWAACKWGIDEDVVRAQTESENWSWDQTTSHGDLRTSYSQCVNGGFTSLWNYKCTNCCYQTWSNWQTKVYYNWQTWPMMDTSTSFAADYRYADQRACMNGDLADYFAGRPSYNGHSYAGDIAAGNLNTILWGCIGFHYSGEWYDGNSTSGATSYINYVKNALAARDWKTRWPAVNWTN